MSEIDCDTDSDFSWSEIPFVIVSEAADFGVPGAIAEMKKRLKELDKVIPNPEQEK